MDHSEHDQEFSVALYCGTQAEERLLFFHGQLTTDWEHRYRNTSGLDLDSHVKFADQISACWHSDLVYSHLDAQRPFLITMPVYCTMSIGLILTCFKDLTTERVCIYAEQCNEFDDFKVRNLCMCSPLFVTWKKTSYGEYNLRGCIGTLQPKKLPEALSEYALIRSVLLICSAYWLQLLLVPVWMVKESILIRGHIVNDM